MGKPLTEFLHGSIQLIDEVYDLEKIEDDWDLQKMTQVIHSYLHLALVTMIPVSSSSNCLHTALVCTVILHLLSVTSCVLYSV